MHIYAFGSICRGEVAFGSDVDLLGVVDGVDTRFDRQKFSVYSYSRLEQLWKQGNPFAWHLAIESRLLFAEDGTDFLRELGRPAEYRQCAADCEKFKAIFADAVEAIRSGKASWIFELSTIFLAIRNIATCFSLGTGKPVFSRNSALLLGSDSLHISAESYLVFESARLLSVRGTGVRPSPEAVASAVASIDEVDTWMEQLLRKARST